MCTVTLSALRGFVTFILYYAKKAVHKNMHTKHETQAHNLCKLPKTYIQKYIGARHLNNRRCLYLVSVTEADSVDIVIIIIIIITMTFLVRLLQ